MSHTPIIVAGSKRSGTAWISQLLNESFRAQYNYDSLEPAYSKTVRRLCLKHRYLCPNKYYPKVHESKVIKGRIWSLRVKTMSRNPLHFHRWKWWRRKQVIKLVQGNLLLGYLKRQFNCRIVYVTRHPCAVIESMTRQRWWKSDLDEFLDGRNEDLWNDYPDLKEEVERCLANLTEPLQRKDQEIPRLERIKRTAIRWAIESYVPYVQSEKEGFFQLSYEPFLQHPQDVIWKVSVVLNVSVKKMPRNLTRPSVTTSPDSPLYAKRVSPINAWRERLSASEIDAILDVIHAFGIDSMGCNPTIRKGIDGDAFLLPFATDARYHKRNITLTKLGVQSKILTFEREYYPGKPWPGTLVVSESWK